jgi:hypothetical protein
LSILGYLALVFETNAAISTFLIGLFVGSTATVLQAEKNNIMPKIKT